MDDDLERDYQFAADVSMHLLQPLADRLGMTPVSLVRSIAHCACIGQSPAKSAADAGFDKPLTFVWLTQLINAAIHADNAVLREQIERVRKSLLPDVDA